ncbi:MAG: site-2 protease family protein [Patescibacteria group bacterium]|nr:site-2 protease family protein [Patescibacteria group bacterium]
MITTIAILVVLYLAICLLVFLHEREHVLVLLRHGFRPHFVAIGAPIPMLWNFYWEVRHARLLKGIPIRFYPLLVGGAYKLDITQLRCLLKCKFALQAEIHSAGIWVNLLLPLLGFGIWGMFAHEWFRAGLCLAGAALLWMGKRLVSVYVFPVLTLLVGIYALPKMFAVILSSHPNVQGTLVHGISTSVHNGLAWQQGLLFVLFASLLFALMNLLPLLPFDGGRMVHAFLKTRWARAARLYAYATIPVCAAIVAYSLFLEAYALLR